MLFFFIPLYPITAETFSEQDLCLLISSGPAALFTLEVRPQRWFDPSGGTAGKVLGPACPGLVFPSRESEGRWSRKLVVREFNAVLGKGSERLG